MKSFLTLLNPGHLVDVDEKTNAQIPLDYVRDRIKEIQRSKDSNILILKSETGSGKSTIFNCMLMKEFGAKVFCTQVTRMVTKNLVNSCINVVKKNNYNLELSPGYNIGYRTGDANLYVERGVPSISFMTMGVLTNILVREFLENFPKLSNSCDFIVVDEAHDRKLELEVLLFLIRKVVTILGKKAPFVVIASATLDIPIYDRYFSLNTGNELSHVVQVSGTSAKRVVKYEQRDVQNVAQSVVAKVFSITSAFAQDDKYRDIMVFCNGARMMNEIQSLIESKTRDVLVVKVSSALIKSDPENLWDIDISTIRGKKFKSKVILGTNVMETGITPSYAAIVIDSCLSTFVYYDNTISSTVWITRKPIHKFSMLQRMGRVGRSFPGTAYVELTERVRDLLQPTSFSDIFTGDVAPALLNVFALANAELSYEELKNDLFLEPLHAEALDEALDKLTGLGCIARGKITELGKLILSLSFFGIENAIMMLSGFVYGVRISDIITVIAWHTFRGKVISDTSTSVKGIHSYFFDDTIMPLIAIARMLRDPKIIAANASSLLEFFTIRNNMLSKFMQLGLNPYQARGFEDIYNVHDPFALNTLKYAKALKKCVYLGYRMNMLYFDRKRNIYFNRKGVAIKVQIHGDLAFPTTILAMKVSTKDDKSPTADVICVLDGFVRVDNALFFEFRFNNVEYAEEQQIPEDLVYKIFHAYRHLCPKTFVPTRSMPA